MIENSNSSPITNQQYLELKDNINEKYILVLEEIYNNGIKLSEVCDKYNLNKRTFQRILSKYGYSYLSIKYGGIADKLRKGYTMDSVREMMGYSIRNDLNQMMWEKVRGDIRPSKRWRILKRDNFRCVLCGADAIDRKLHIDHIKPVTEGGKSIPKNLRVLCSVCNSGRNIDLNRNRKV